MDHVVHRDRGPGCESTAEVYSRHLHRLIACDLWGEIKHPLSKSFCLRDAMMITKQMYKTFAPFKMNVQSVLNCLKLNEKFMYF